MILAFMLFLALFSGIGQANTIEVENLTDSLNAGNLVNILLGENSSVVVSNITVTGTNLAIGKFTNGGTLGFDTGVVMTTGNLSHVSYDMSFFADTNNTLPGDSDLDVLVNNITYDAVVLEFDFIPEKGSISFNYRLSSEEDFLDVYDDAFGLFVNGANVALLPNGYNVSVTNIGHGPYYEASPLNTCFNGSSIILTASAEVMPNTLNHMKFAIADARDGIWDSAVFIEGGSFVSNTLPNAPVAPLCEGETNPTNVSDLTPEFSWTFSDPDVNDTQGAYQILVGTSAGDSDMWESGKVTSSSSTDISYAGSALGWNTTYHWRVKTWDNYDDEGTYCENQTFVTSALPVANFTANVTSGALPLSVSFTDLSSNTPTSWFWDFGDGNNSTDQNAAHIYASVGIYTVSLNATNAGGSNVSTQTDYITVAIEPVASFSSNVTSGAVPLSVNFTDESANSPISWLWDFGDGNTSTDQNPAHTYVAAGTYNVTMNATNVGGSNVTTQTNYITVAIAPVASFTANVTSGAVPLSVNFTDTSTNTPTSWLWDFGDGNTSTDQNPTYTYTAVGTYSINLNATNAGGSNISTQTEYITAAFAPVSNFSANVTEGAVPLSVNFTDTSTNSPTSWLWDFGDGNTSTVQNPAHIYVAAGIYNVSLNATNVGGSNVSTQLSFITAAYTPVAGFTSNVTSGAVPLSVSFTDQSTNATAWYWDFGDGNTSALQNPTHTYMDVGTYNVNLTAINSISGNDTLTRTDYITVAIAPVASFTANVTSGAVPLSVNFTDGSANAPISWSWDFGDGTNSTEQNPTHTYASAGTYTVSLNSTNVAGSNTSTQNDYITAAVTPVTSFTANVTFGAIPLSVNFTDLSGNSPTSWFWDFGDGTNSTDRNVTHTYTSAGTFIVNLTATNAGGSNINTQTIITDSVPVSNFSADVTSGAIPLAVNFTDQSVNATAWYWEFGDGNASALQNPTHTYMDVGTYNVNLTAINSISGNDTLTRTGHITVAIAPIANFTASATSGTAPFAVTFTDLSTNSPTAWAWDFGDGATSTDQNATYTYTSAGTYAVSLNASNVGGSNVSTQMSYITVSSANSDSGRRASLSPGQPPESVTSTYTSVKHVMGGTSVEYDLSSTGSPVLGISFDAKDNEGLVVAKVQVLSDRPEGIPNPPGNSYQLMSIDVGSQGTISSHNADNIKINFKVSWDWIRENNIDPSTIRLTRYYDGEWQKLPTGKVSDDGQFIHFVAETPGFSIFSVVGDELGTTEGEKTADTALFEEATEVPIETEDKNTPGFTGLMGLLFVAVAFLASRRSRL
ncbi:PKD domain-containing protein [Methanolobus sp.]|uniref:PKD domain-containing protein n=1 Tax=Methanolobus sp. TaxID=1874737 RepID=UPI0026007AD1|nr:PKD domain-containing protein [Methanolobus sp.]